MLVTAKPAANVSFSQCYYRNSIYRFKIRISQLSQQAETRWWFIIKNKILSNKNSVDFPVSDLKTCVHFWQQYNEVRYKLVCCKTANCSTTIYCLRLLIPNFVVRWRSADVSADVTCYKVCCNNSLQRLLKLSTSRLLCYCQETPKWAALFCFSAILYWTDCSQV